MSEERAAAGAARRVGSGSARLVRAWKVLPHESRLAASASGALFLTLFLPWYQVTLIAPAKAAKLQSASATITGWGAFSFVEAAVLLVAAGVLTLLFQRAEGRAFHLPGGDGGVIAAAGVWTSLLIVWRIFDKQGSTTNGPSATTSGVEWGIFIALGAAIFLAYAGSRIRAAHRPEPPLPGEAQAPAGSNAAATTEVIATDRRRRPSAATVGAGEWESRRRSRPPRPVPAERRSPIATGPPPAPDHSSDATPVRPRRRMSPDELFERVVPEDPPAVPFGRIPRAEDPVVTRATPPATPTDEADDTLPLGGDEALRLSGDDTQPLGGDDTQPPLGRGGTLPLGGDKTLPMDEDDTLPFDRRRKGR
jgi:hypothetical protein